MELQILLCGKSTPQLAAAVVSIKFNEGAGFAQERKIELHKLLRQ